MEKLDRLGWAAGIAFYSHGVRFGIRTNRPEILCDLEPFLPPGRRPLADPVVQELYSLRVASGDPTARTRQMNLAYSGIARLERGPDLLPVLEALETDLLLRVAERSRHTFVRCAAIEWNGGAVLILGKPGSGKTTLLQAFLSAGARYLSDRCAVLDREGRVHPYPVPIPTQSPDAGPAAARVRIEETRLARHSVPVAHLLFTEYRPGARWRPRLLSEGEAALALLPHALAARRRPRTTLTRLHSVARQAAAFKSSHGEAEELAALLMQA